MIESEDSNGYVTCTCLQIWLNIEFVVEPEMLIALDQAYEDKA